MPVGAGHDFAGYCEQALLKLASDSNLPRAARRIAKEYTKHHKAGTGRVRPFSTAIRFTKALHDAGVWDENIPPLKLWYLSDMTMLAF